MGINGSSKTAIGNELLKMITVEMMIDSVRGKILGSKRVDLIFCCF